MSMRAMRRRFLLGGTALLAGAVAGTIGFAHAEERVIKVVARKFVFLPSTIALKKGQPVVLEFTAPEVVMGFFCAELNLRTMIIPGQPARVRWTADRAGRFDFICDVFCGDGHEYMNGHLVVT